MHAAVVYTRVVFFLFRPVIERSSTCNIVATKKHGDLFTYTVTRSQKEGMAWEVSYCATDLHFKCSCQRMESLGISCDHLVRVIQFLNIVVLPDCLILPRWTKSA